MSSRPTWKALAAHWLRSADLKAVGCEFKQYKFMVLFVMLWSMHKIKICKSPNFYATVTPKANA